MKDRKITMIDSTTGNDYSVLLCAALHDIGMDVELIVPANRELNVPVQFEIKYWMVSKDPTEGKLKKIIQYFRYLLRLIRYVLLQKRGKHVVHFQFFRFEKIEALLIVFFRIFGRNMVFTAHNIFPHERTRFDRFFRNLIYQSVSGIIVHSNYIKKKLLNSFAMDEEKIRIIPHGDFDHYLPDTPLQRTDARSRLNLSKDDRAILFFGFIREYKGLDLLLDAIENLGNSVENLRLVIAGNPMNLELKERYLDRISKLADKGIEILHFLNFIPYEEVPIFFRAADLVVLPYKAIDHSGIIHLAYSFGVPVLATDVGDFSETIEDGKSGFIVEGNDAMSLSAMIKEAFSEKYCLKEMGAYAEKLSREKYSWVAIAKSTKDFYNAQ